MYKDNLGSTQTTFEECWGKQFRERGAEGQILKGVRPARTPAIMVPHVNINLELWRSVVDLLGDLNFALLSFLMPASQVCCLLHRILYYFNLIAFTHSQYMSLKELCVQLCHVYIFERIVQHLPIKRWPRRSKMKTKFDLTQFEDNSDRTTCTVSVLGWYTIAQEAHSEVVLQRRRFSADTMVPYKCVLGLRQYLQLLVQVCHDICPDQHFYTRSV